MEEKIVTTDLMNEKLVLDKHLLFEWKCLDRKYVGSHVEMRFVRDDSVPYIKKLRKLEKSYGDPRIRSMIPTIILPIISIGLFTAFLVVFFINRDNFNFLLYFLSLLLPAIICLLGAVVFMILRSRAIGKIETEKSKKEEEYRKKIEQIKQPTTE